MDVDLQIGVRTWDTYWEDCNDEQRTDLIDDSATFLLREGAKDFSKRRIFVTCCEATYRVKKTHVIDDIYSFLESHSSINYCGGHYISILFWIMNNMKNGYLCDYYYIYRTISSYYRDTGQLEKSLYYDKLEYHMHNNIISDYQAIYNVSLEDATQSVVGGCMALVDDLKDFGDFDGSRRTQQECLNAGFFDFNPNDSIKVRVALHWHRLEAELNYYKKAGRVMPNTEDIDALSDLSYTDLAATGYKRLADIYYNIKDYRQAIIYYKMAIDLWPDVYAARTKLHRAQKKCDSQK